MIASCSRRAWMALCVASAVACAHAPEPVEDETPAVLQPAPPTRKLAEKAALGAKVPDFDLLGVDGKRVKLSAYQGKVTVLEWFNPDCPFIRWAHGEGPLKDMAARYHRLGVAWLTINSSGPGKQGHGMERNLRARDEYGLLQPLLLDEDGEVGRLFGATHTPHVFVINREGVLVYAGGVDNLPFGELARPGEAPSRYLDAALSSVLLGQPVARASTPAWGCTVKYAR